MKALLTVSSILLSAGIALGQQPTSPPSNAAQNSNGVPSFWKPYSTIHVFIDGTKFPPGSALESAVKQGFTENQNGFSDQGVTYVFSSVQSPPNLSNNQAYVTTQSFSDPTVYGHNSWTTTFNSVYGYNFTSTATITLNPKIFGNTESVAYAASHEDSHDYGLGDCPTCAANSSEMSYNNNISDPPFIGPTDNDINSFGTYSGGGGGYGYGYCPIDDNCPARPNDN